MVTIDITFLKNEKSEEKCIIWDALVTNETSRSIYFEDGYSKEKFRLEPKKNIVYDEKKNPHKVLSFETFCCPDMNMFESW